MKKSLFMLVAGVLLTFCISAHAQHSEAHKLDKQIKVLMDSATHNMVLFILKQDETEYTAAMAKVEKAKAMTKEYKELVKKESGVSGRSDAEEAAMYVEEINMFYKPKLKETVMADKKKTEKFKYKGQTYTIGTKSKSLIEAFLEE